jgi:hypothetical protein
MCNLRFLRNMWDRTWKKRGRKTWDIRIDGGSGRREGEGEVVGKNNTHATYGTTVIFRALVLGLLAAG